jgi:hypothetical protein
MPIQLPRFNGLPNAGSKSRVPERNRAPTFEPSRLPDRPDVPSGRLPATPSASGVRPQRASLESLHQLGGGHTQGPPGPPRLLDVSDERVGAGPRPAASMNRPVAHFLPGAPVSNFNGKVHVTQPDASGNAVVCRHFATDYIAAMNKQDVLSDFASMDRISNRFEGRLHSTNATFESLMYQRQAMPKNMISGNALGGYLEHVADTLAKQRLGPPDAQGRREAQANILLNTSNHAMALHVQRQQDASGKETFSVTVFDPNRTANQKTAVASRPGDFAGMKMADFANDRYVKALTGPHAQDLLMSATSIDARVPPTKAGLIPPDAMSHPATAAAALHVAMRSGVVDAFAGVAQAAKQAPTAQIRMQILSGQSGKGETAIKAAMGFAPAQSIQAYGDLVMAADLAPHEKKALLIGNPKGRLDNPMAMGAFRGNAPAMTACAVNLRRAGIAGQELIAATEWPGSLIAAAAGSLDAPAAGRHADSAAALFQVLGSSGLSSEQKATLLTQPEPGQKLGPLGKVAAAGPEIRAAVLSGLRNCGLKPEHQQALAANFEAQWSAAHMGRVRG